ncbi:hypothetical protein GCM10009564_09620 [Streptomyces thermogriseus]|uniref:Uncharacterized protein n=1 Tax=Streptomyces thermogriseus TaxID=75292 RepID=A0ABN1SUA9_9ACTN
MAGPLEPVRPRLVPLRMPVLLRHSCEAGGPAAPGGGKAPGEAGRAGHWAGRVLFVPTCP